MDDPPQEPFVGVALLHHELGLEVNVAELDTYGFTVVAPDKVGPPLFAEAVRTAVLHAGAERFGVPEERMGEEETARDHPFFFRHGMLARGEAFEAALMNEVSLALITHLLGSSCVLSSMGGFLKGPGTIPLELHADNVGIPAPFPTFSQVANSTLVLSDYSEENGSICFAPRSHKLCRHPLADEVDDATLSVPVEAAAGSLIVFHGNTWHGAFSRTAPGYRISVIQYFCRMYLSRQEDPADGLAAEASARHPARFGRLLGEELPYPLQRQGFGRMFAANAAGKAQHS